MKRALLIGQDRKLVELVQAALIANQMGIAGHVADVGQAVACLPSQAVDCVVLSADGELAEALAHLRQGWRGGLVVLGSDDEATLALTHEAGAALVLPPYRIGQIRAALHMAAPIAAPGVVDGAPAPQIQHLSSTYPLGHSLVEQHIEPQTEPLRAICAHMATTWPDLVCLLDSSGKILSVSESIHNILGFAAHAVIGQSCHTLMAQDDFDELLRRMGTLAHMQQPLEIATRWRHGNGTTVYLNLSVSAALENDQVLFVGRNVTPLREVELALRASEERYRLAGSAAHDILWDWDLVAHRFTWGEALLARTGHDPDQVDSSDTWWIAQVHPDDRARVRVSVQAALNGDSDRWSDEYRLCCADNTYIYVIDRGLIVRDAAGQAMRMVGSMVDITELRAAQEALRESDLRYRLLAQATNDVVWDWDLVTQEIMVSDNVYAVFQYAAQELHFEPGWWSSRIHPEDSAHVKSSLDEAIAGTVDVWTANYRFRQGDGSYATVLDRGYIMRDAGGAARRMIGSMFDLTPYRTVKRQLEESQVRLEHAQKMEAVGRLAGGVAHDFNNLLTVIGSYGDLAYHKLAEGDPVRRYIGQIRNATATAAVLTRQLLALSRRQALQPKIINLNALVEEVGTMVRSIIGPHIQMRIHQDPELGQVEADDGQLHQVLLNLVVNAKDAMPEGGVLILETRNFLVTESHARQNPQLTPGSYIRLTVADSGIGMDQATLTRIFEPFFTTKPSGVGTGLGLATVYGIVQQSHGSITVYSEVGCGTTFHVYLPRVDKVDVHQGDDETEHVVAGGAETILLVEDETPVRELVKLLLQEAGYRVLSAAGPHEALAMERDYHGPIDLLLTDVVMPHMNGHLLAGELLRRRPTIRIVYMSGYTEDVMQYQHLLDVDVRLIEKPFAPSDVLRAVRQVLDQPGAGIAAEQSMSYQALML
jgi:PAS domain S-box-containing protein